ncbi:hypothetical protein D3C83_172530 [compost metagenome]
MGNRIVGIELDSSLEMIIRCGPVPVIIGDDGRKRGMCLTEVAVDGKRLFGGCTCFRMRFFQRPKPVTAKQVV